MSIKATVDKIAKRKGVRSIEIEKADNGGYVTNTHHHDYEKPREVGAHKNLKSVMNHIKNCYGSNDKGTVE